jgi:hypothetical protein
VRSGRAAYWLLSLILPSERASAIVGDLLEETAARGRFWMHVAGTAGATLGNGVMAAPLAMYVGAGLGWFVYMAVCLGLILVGWAVAGLLWGALYVVGTHTGIELLGDLFQLRVGWPPPSDALGRAVEISVMSAVAPCLFGRASARHWSGSELVAGVIVALVWPLLSMLVPFAAFYTRATLWMMPVVAAFVLAGSVWGRLDALRRTSIDCG